MGTTVAASTEEASQEWPPRAARTLQPVPSTPILLTQGAEGQIPEEDMPQAAEAVAVMPMAAPCAAPSPFALGIPVARTPPADWPDGAAAARQ
eukprot:136573-Lingulodinium_polyedra.AAC.1